MGETPVSDYDAIVIGSGIGGLCAASLLAQVAGKRVLVLERHYVIGGFTHEFKRQQGRHWDVGVHYVGDLHEGSLGRAVFDYVSRGRLRWNRMAEPFERFVYPDFTFELVGDEATFRSDLIRRFPGERAAIERYFRDLKRATGWGMRRFASELLPAPIVWAAKPFRLASKRLRWASERSRWASERLRWASERLGGGSTSRRLALSTTQAYLDASFADPKLKALLVSQWGTHGLSPERSAFLSHAIIVTHYLAGGYYPVGGASSIARTIVPTIEEQGGAVRIRREVRQILVDRGRAVGVEAVCHKGGVERMETYRAPLVLSDAGAHNTYGRLLPREIGSPFLEQIERLGSAPTAASLYVAFRDDPRQLGVRGENYWIYPDTLHDEAQQCDDALRGRPSACYLSFPSLKDPEATGHTAEILVFLGYEAFKPWADRPWKKRGPEYEALKERLADGMLDLVDRHLPGFRELVAYAELSTPISVEHFTGAPRGAIYGLPGTPERFQQSWLGTRTPVRNLYLAGSDVYFHGVLGAAMGGVAAATACLGSLGPLRVVTAIRTGRRTGPREGIRVARPSEEER